MKKNSHWVSGALVVLLALLLTSFDSARAAVNDNFANATTFTGSNPTVTGNNIGATMELLEPGVNVSASVWWKWTAPSDGFITIDTSGTSFKNVLIVYQGTALTALDQVGYSQDSIGTMTSQVIFPTKSGQSYYIQVGSVLLGGNGGGTIVMHLQTATLASGGIVSSTVYGAPAVFNDTFANRLTLVGTSLTALGFNASAGLDLLEPGLLTGHTLWWTWTAPSDGVVTIDTIGTTFSNTLGLYQGTALVNLTPLAYSQNGIGADESQIQFNAIAGRVYQIQVGSASLANQTGTVILNVTPDTHPLGESLFFQNLTSIGVLTVGSDFLPGTWEGIGGMNLGWQLRAVADMNGDGIPDLIFQNGTLIGILTLDADRNPVSWIGVGSMNLGWQLRGAGDVNGDGQPELFFQNGTLLGYLSVNTSGVPQAWAGIGAMGLGWDLHAVADFNDDGHPELFFQKLNELGVLQISTTGLPTAWTDLGAIGTGQILSAITDVDGDGQIEFIYQNGTNLSAQVIGPGLQLGAFHGIGGMGLGWALPGDY